MGDHKTSVDPSELVASGELDLQDDIIGIAERALWKPANIGHDEIRRMAAAIIAHTRRQDLDRLSFVDREQRDGF